MRKYRRLKLSYAEKALQRRRESNLRRFRCISLVMLAGLLGLIQPAYAAPKVDNIANGQVSISQDDKLTEITASDNAIINYHTFDIAYDETVRFIQPSETARVLNRVNSEDPSTIAGKLLANGQVYIVNSAGIYFTDGSLVDVGSLYAAAGQISDHEFLAGQDNFHDLSGQVVNDGTIMAETVALVGRFVANNGDIISQDGLITLAAGDDVYLTRVGSHVMVKVADMSDAAVSSDDGISNTGSINAGNGEVSLVSSDIVGLAMGISSGGNIKAADITLDSGANGLTEVTGNLDASSDMANGGSVKVLGDKIALKSASIDVSGKTGGGEVLVGGDFQGSGEVRNASRTYIDSDTSITADAVESGNGGKVICWADEITAFIGDISAKGGAESGDGGFVEVSGKENLMFDGYVDASAEKGQDGQLLLDPRDIVIGAAGNDDGEIDDLSILFDDGLVNETFEISEAKLEILAGGANITIQAERNLTIQAMSDGVLNFATTAGNTVTLEADANSNGGDFIMSDTSDTIQTAGGNIVITTGSSQFTAGSFNSNGGDINLDADGSISVNQITTNGGDLTVVADENYNAAGDFIASGTISTNGGDVSIDGVNINLVTLNSTGGDVILTPAEIAISTALNTGAGNLTIYPRVASHMDIGSDATGLDISDTELGRITCSGVFTLGDASNTSTMDIQSITDHAGISGTMQFLSNGDIEIANGTISTVTTPSVAFYADDGVNINGILILGQDTAINCDTDVDGIGSFYAGFSADRLDTSAANANITITAADLDFGDESAARIDAGSGNITLIASNNRTMGISTANFNVTDAEMDRIDTTGTLTFDTASSFTVNENMTCEQSTAIIAGGGVTQNNRITVAGNLSVTADVANSNIVLTHNLNDVSGTVSLNTLGTGDASWTENSNIDFAASAVSGDLAVDANGNDLADSGAVSVGLTFAITDTNNVTLDLLSGDIGLAASDINTNLDLSVANGSITQSGALTVGGTADFAVTTANEDITLNNTSNAVTGQVTFSTTGTTGNVVFDNGSTAIDLGASTINGGLDIDSSGHLTVNGAVTTAGAAYLTVDDITMTSTLNAGTAAITIAPDDNGTIGLGATPGNMTLTDGELDNITTSGTVTFDTNSAITVDSITPSNITGQFFLDSLSTVSFVNGGSTFSGNLRVRCTDLDVSQTVDCGANSVLIGAVNNKHIYLGTAAANGNIDITGTELQNITAAGLELNTGDGENIYVNNVTATNSNNIGTVILDSAEDVIFQTNNSVFNALTVEADDGLAINDGIILQTDTGAMSLDGNVSGGAFAITTGGNITLDSAGTLTLNELTAGGDIDITATDLTINQTVSMGANSLTINTAGTVGIGDTAGAMTISPTEFGRISSTTGDVTIISTGGSFTVNNISAANSNGIGGIVTLQASGDDQNITFASNNSTFNTLTLNSDDGIFINNVIVGTDVGDFILTPDFDGGANDANDKINFSGAGAGMITATSFSVGTINVANALTLRANGSITFTADQTVPDGINIVADLDANGTGNFVTNAGVDVNTSGNNGDINIAAANLQLNGDSLNAGTGTITFVPQQATDVSLGTDSGTFGISAAELALMTADALVIGDTSASFNTTSAQFSSVAIDGNFAAGAKTVDIQTSGTATVSNGITLSTTNENITINANDLAMNTTGAINAGSAALALNVETAGNDLVLGGTGQEYNIDDTELANITSGSLTITVRADDDIYVSGVADAVAENVGSVTLIATGDNSTITFDTASAQFDSLSASADSGITISQNITADTGNLVLEGDADNAADANDNLAVSDGVTLTSSNGSVSLAATTGDIDAAGALTLNAAAGVTISDTYVAAGAGALTVNADSDGNGAGTFTAGSTITTVNSLVSITAADVVLNGNVDSGNGGITILPSNTAGQTVIFGAAGGDMGLTAAEVGYLNTSGTLTVGNANTTSLTVSTDPTNSTGAVILVSSDTGGVIIVNGVFTPDTTLSMTALEGITVSSNITTGGTITIDADSDDTNNGTLTVDNGVTLASTNDTITITAKDIVLTGTGAIDSGSAAMSITQSQAAGTIGLGGTAGTMQITDTELDNITATGFTIYAPSDVTINGVTADTGNTIDGTFLVDATGKVTFATADSDFKTLEIQADDGIQINTVTVSTDTGSITMDGNVDNSADASDTIAFVGVSGLDSQTTIALTSTNDGITSAAATTITANDQVTVSDAFVASAALDVTSNNNAIVFSSNFTGGGTTNFSADDGITLNGNVSLGGTTTFDSDVDNGDNNGTFTLAATRTITTNNHALTISADDLDLAGSIAGGAGLLRLDVSDGGTAGLAAATGDFSVSTAELARITGQSGGMTVSGASGTVTINSMDVDTNITGTTTIDATNDNTSVNFTGAASEFAALTVNSDSGIDISVNLTTTNGNMVLEGDADNAADTNDDIDLTGNRTLTAVGGELTMDATTGKIDGDGTLTLRADDGITINDNLTSAGTLTIDADRDDDTTGTLTIAGVTSSSNNLVAVTADDISITGSLSSGTADMWITPSTAISIGLGTGAGSMSLTAAEINALTANDLYLGLGVATDLAVNTITTAGINGDFYIDITGDMSIAGGQWDASADDSNFDIICNDMNLSADLNADTGSIRVRTSDGGGIGLGTAAQGMTLSNTDLVRFVTSGGLTLETQAGENIEVTGVTTGNTNNITGTLTLDADTNGSQVNFTNTASALRNNVVVRADNGVDIDVNLTVENGSLSINGDTDSVADGRDYISMANGVTITAGNGALTLTAASGDLLADGALTLTSTGKTTINDDLTTNNGASTNLPLIINASDLDFNGSALNADAGAITIRPSSVSNMGLGGTATGAFDFTDAEFDKITTSGLVTFGGTNAANITVDGFTASANVSGGVSIVSGQNAGSIVFANNSSSFQNTLNLQALDGITINDDVTSGGAITINSDTDAGDNVGLLTIANGITIDSTNTNINITADDISIGAGGSIDAGAADMLITDSDNTGIGLGGTPVVNGVNITDVEFGGLIANNLEFVTAGNITVNGITAANSNNIANTLTLDTAGNIEFASNTSTFNELVAEADGLIQVNANIVTDTDVLNLYGDTNGNAGGAASIIFAAGTQIDSNTTTILDATSSGIVGNSSISGTGAMTVKADDGITVENSISAGGTLTIDADQDTDGTGNLTIAAGASVNATGNDVDITANTVTFGAGVLTNVADLTLSATIYGDLTVNGDFNNSGSVTLESINGTITINSDISSDESFTLTAKNGITINNNITADADTNNAGGESIVIIADSDGDGTGDLTVKTAGKSIITNNNDLAITANDLDMQNDYAFAAGTGKITITESEGTGIGLGDTAVATGLNVTTGELVRMTAADTEFISAGNVLIDNVTAVSSNNIGLLVIDNEGQSRFINNASVFNALTVESDDGIDIDVNITTDTGNLSLDGDSDTAADTNDDIQIAAGISLRSQTNMTLAAQTGKISAAGTLSLLSESDININDNIVAADVLTINTDGIVVDNDGTGDLIVAADATISTEVVNKQINLIANDIFLNGYVRTGTSTFDITVSDNQDYALGSNAVENGSNNAFNINATELSHIYTGNLDLNTSGDVDISNVLAGSADNITYMVTFNIDGHATLSNDCIFNAITINANDGIDIGGNLTSQVGNIVLEGDANDADDGNGLDNILFSANSTITCANTLTLDATTGALDGSGALTLTASEGININDDLSTNGNLTINADSDLDGTGDLASASGKTYSCNGNDLDITGANVAFDSGITNVAGLFLTATTGDMEIIGDISFNNTGDLGLAVTNGTCLIDKVLSTQGSVTISASDGVDIRQNITSQGNIVINSDNDANQTGNLSIASGVQIYSNGGTIEITANDVDQLSGTLNSGIYVTKIDSTSVGINIGSGSGSGMNISNLELANIRANTLEFVTSGDIVVAGVEESSNASIATVVLDAEGSITFQSSESVFNILDIQAEGGIVVNADVATDTGELLFNNDSSYLSGGNSGIIFGDGVTLTSALGLTIGGGGDLTANGDVTLVASGDITILSDFNIASGLNVNTNNNIFDISGVDVVVSADGPVNIVSGDIDLTGTLSSLLGVITITPEGGTVGLGDATGTLSLSNNELAVITSDKLIIDAAGGITAANIVSGTTTNIGTLELDSEDVIVFNGVVINSNLNALSSEGISQTGSLAVTGGTQLVTNADDKTIILDNAGNALVGSVTIQTQSDMSNEANVILNNGSTALVLADSIISGDLTLETNSTISLAELAVNENLEIDADGTVSQTAKMTVGGNLTGMVNLSGSNLTLDNTENIVSGNVAFYTVSDGDVTFNNSSSDISILEAVVGGDLNLETTDIITCLGAVTVTGDADIDAGSSFASGDDFVVSGNMTADIDGTFTSNGYMEVGKDLILTADGTVSNIGDILITGDAEIDTGGAYTAVGSVTIGGSLTLVAADNVTDNEPIVVAGNTDIKTLDNTGADIILDNTGNSFGLLNLYCRNESDTAYTGGDIVLYENEDIEIDNIATRGTLQLTAEGNITESTSMSVNGAIVLKTLNDVGGDITLAGDNYFGQLDIDVRDLSDSNVSDGNVQVIENGSLEIASIETAGGIHLTCDDIELAGVLAGSNLTILPMSDGTSIGIGDGSNGDMKLSSAEIAGLADGFSQISIGRSDATGKVVIEDITFTDPFAIYTAGNASLDGTITGLDNSSILVAAANGMTINEDIITQGNDISLAGGFIFSDANVISTGNISGALLLDGNAQTNNGVSFIAPDGISLNGIYDNTGGGAMLYDGSLNLADNVTINSDTAEVKITGLIDGSYDLEVNSNGGNIYFGGDMGTSQDLANLTVITNETGSIEFNSEINVLGDIYISSNQSLGIIPAEATIFKKNEGDLVFNAGGKFEVGLNNRITVSNGSLMITTSSDVVSIGDATVKGNIIVNSMDAAGDIILLLRDKTESYVMNKNGTIKLLNDKGMAIAAEGYIQFNGQIVSQGEGSKPYFVSGNKKESDGLTGYKVYTIKEIEELIGEDENGNEIIIVYIPVSENKQINVDPICAGVIRKRDDIYYDQQIGDNIYYASNNWVAVEPERVIENLAEAWFGDNKIKSWD